MNMYRDVFWLHGNRSLDNPEDRIGLDERTARWLLRMTGALVHGLFQCVRVNST